MKTHRTVPVVTYETAAEAVAVGIREAERRGVKAVVTVVDPGLLPLALGRADGSPPHSLETSRRKAMIAASMRRPTATIPPELIIPLEHGSGGLITSIQGGVPLTFDGSCVAGLGVAGGTPEQDAGIARAILIAIGADDVSESTNYEGGTVSKRHIADVLADPTHEEDEAGVFGSTRYNR
ncbi:heme-binding protein [Paenarthrobacter sp. YJN-5]|uniref:GlcG/HbpS family heme-binding protein n=1 Tax=Paenarthrobacter sp. YJN-5 TaxID=2735316 RepID=UPI001878571D|nr:heme-binding protein [Paenarthrobacter sp. YJN-5]QOT19824.1 heme-binding protein [Paenarthrobacter sp. YJN-5]